MQLYLSGIFPDDWKFVGGSAIYKSGHKQECENDRLTSVMSVAAKIFEKLVLLFEKENINQVKEISIRF